MEVYITSNPTLYEETITTDYATAKLLEQLHKDTAVLINERRWSEVDDNKPATIYRITWRKGR